jgi:hypothetical protein
VVRLKSVNKKLLSKVNVGVLSKLILELLSNKIDLIDTLTSDPPPTLDAEDNSFTLFLLVS